MALKAISTIDINIIVSVPTLLLMPETLKSKKLCIDSVSMLIMDKIWIARSLNLKLRWLNLHMKNIL